MSKPGLQRTRYTAATREAKTMNLLPRSGIKSQVWLLGGLVLVATVPRLLGALHPLWLDEIWSLDLARGARTPFGVLTSIHHDNNHYLNTMWIQAVGRDASWLSYRLPALLAGLATVLMAVRIEWEEGVRNALVVGLLFALSLPLVQYAAEARGYAPAVFFSLLAFWSLGRYHERRGPAFGALFVASMIMGLLSHLTALIVALSLLAWSAWVTVARTDPYGRALRLMGLHALPVALLAWLFLVDVQHWTIGGGSDRPALNGWSAGARYMLGVPIEGPAGGVALAAFAPVLVVGLRDWWRKVEYSSGFFLLVLITPVLLLSVLDATFAPPRYFLVSLAFGLLATGRGLGVLLRNGGWARCYAVVMLAAFLLGNLARTTRFVVAGHGDHRALIEHMVKLTPGDTIRVASDHPLESELVLEYHGGRIPDSKTLTVVLPRSATTGAADSPERPADWFVEHRGLDSRPTDDDGRPFRPDSGWTVARVFPQSGLSGSPLVLYGPGSED